MLINLTPHRITVINNGEETNIGTNIEPSGIVARASTRAVEDGNVDGIPVVRIEYGQIENLPEPQPGVYYVVSSKELKQSAALG